VMMRTGVAEAALFGGCEEVVSQRLRYEPPATHVQEIIRGHWSRSDAFFGPSLLCLCVPAVVVGRPLVAFRLIVSLLAAALVRSLAGSFQDFNSARVPLCLYCRLFVCSNRSSAL
jgi:hypothetical protein